MQAEQMEIELTDGEAYQVFKNVLAKKNAYSKINFDIISQCIIEYDNLWVY